MKNVVLLLSVLLFSTSCVSATAAYDTTDKVSETPAYRYNDSFIFVQNGITFSVYPDGEFDFYIENQVSGRRNGVTFNSGYDYSPFAQYDDYGAVVQVEDVPVYYDYYGRVSQIGEVDINYRRNRVRSVGGMYVYYNQRGFYDYHTGYINIYNRNYVYRPYHAFFARPAVGLSLVYNRPYRRYYDPVRYTYYNPYRYNTRRAYAKVGRTHRYNKVRSERSRIYRNDQRVSVRNSSVRSNRSVAKRADGVARSSSAARSNRTVAQRSASVRTGNSNTSRKVARAVPSRSSSSVSSRNGTTASSRSSARTPARTTSNTATRSSSSRTVNKAPARSRNSVSSRSSSARSTVNRSPSRNLSVGSKSSARSSRTSASRTSSSRSSRRY